MIPKVVLYLALRGLNSGQKMVTPRNVQSVRSAPPGLLGKAEALIQEKYPDDPVLLHIASAYNALEPSEKKWADWTSASLAFAEGEGKRALRILQGHRPDTLPYPAQTSSPASSSEPELGEPLDPEAAAETVRGLIRGGENSRVEFKSTLRWDLENNCKNGNMTNAALKAICALLNRAGGTLLVGVADDGRVLGLSADRFESNDECCRFIADKVRNQLGAGCIRYVNYYFASLAEGEVLVIECKESPDPVFLGPEFVVRDGSKSPSLNSKDSVQYALDRFRRAA